MDFEKVLNVHLKYADYLKEKTILTLNNDDFTNIRQSGDDVENEIRDFLRTFIPSRFKVTHGHIIYAENNASQPKVSNQVDAIIVDTLVPHSILPLDKKDGVEIVPVESVVAIFEIKRKLTKETFLSALGHLKKVMDSVSITKNNKQSFMPGGVLTTNTTIRSNPLVGVISIFHEPFLDSFSENKFDNKMYTQMKSLCLDLCFSINGLLISPMKIGTGKIPIRNERTGGDLEYGYMDSQVVSAAALLSRAMGFILGYLNNTTGRQLDIRNYFFNQATWRLTKKLTEKIE